ncbi:MAG: RDD family protein [Kiritimatiellaeota bacterium]|nr:RDD family protein [Kiritimatiellota bacterium]
MASNWYFEENGERVGPFDDAEIKDIISQGRLTADTLVWNENMTDWANGSETELRVFFDQGTGGDAVEVVEISEEPYPVASRQADKPIEVDAAEVAQCANCGGMFKTDELVDIDGATVCADCKPQYLRKLQEGGESNSIFYHYAGFWIRALAIIIDWFILFAIQFPISIVFGVVIGMVGAMFKNSEIAGTVSVVLIQIVNMLVSLSIQMLYEVIFVVKKSATPGKMALGLKVINTDGTTQISYGKSFGRYFAKMLNGFTLYIGYMMAGWDDEKRGLHDRICETRVIYSK